MTVAKSQAMSDTCDMKFIRALREQQGISRAELSQRSGVQEGTIRVIERGTVRVELSILRALREALGLTWEAYGRLIDKEGRETESSDK
jgi:transcriptional regulator with XRE-family HTH domain